MNLIIVPCHGVCIDPTEPELAASWIGVRPGEAPCLYEHAVMGALKLIPERRVLLMFSGGQTQPAAGPRSEAQSYREILAAKSPQWSALGDRCVLEEYARDSLENLIFSVARFVQLKRGWPDFIQVLGWKFKRRRFDCHRQALAWPAEQFEYQGLNNPEALAEAEAGERQKLLAVQNDLYLAAPIWREQRQQRDPFCRGNPYWELDSRLDAIFERMS